jgi:hypothetical protein
VKARARRGVRFSSKTGSAATGWLLAVKNALEPFTLPRENERLREAGGGPGM